MDVFYLDTVRVESVADTVDGLNQDITSEVETPNNSVNNLSGVWTSPHSAEIIEKFSTIYSAVSVDRFNVIKQYTDFLRSQVNTGYITVEETNKKLAEEFK